MAEPEIGDAPEGQTNQEPARKKRKKASAQHLPSILDRYVDIPQKAKGCGGRKGAPILDEVSVFTTRKTDPKRTPIWRCAGAENRCDKTFPDPRNKARILKHAAEFIHLNGELTKRINSELAKDAPGALHAAAQLKNSPTLSKSRDSPRPGSSFPTSPFTFTTTPSSPRSTTPSFLVSVPNNLKLQPQNSAELPMVHQASCRARS